MTVGTATGAAGIIGVGVALARGAGVRSGAGVARAVGVVRAGVAVARGVVVARTVGATAGGATVWVSTGRGLVVGSGVGEIRGAGRFDGRLNESSPCKGCAGTLFCASAGLPNAVRLVATRRDTKTKGFTAPGIAIKPRLPRIAAPSGSPQPPPTPRDCVDTLAPSTYIAHSTQTVGK